MNNASGHFPDAAMPRFQLVAFDDMRPMRGPAWLVKGLIPRCGLTVVWGAPKSGKSFWVFDLVMHVALGREYRGRRVLQGPVVYLILEGATGFAGRIEAYRRARLADLFAETSVPFFSIAARVDLIRDAVDLIGSIKAELGAAVPVAVIVDTLNRSLAGSESNDEVMTAYIKAADVIREAFRCAVMIVHHSGHDASRPRGHSSLTGAADAQLSVKRDADGNVAAHVEWMKDGPEGETIVSRLVPVEIGTDEDGDAITSCVVEPVDDLPGAKAAPKRKLPDRQELALSTLRDLCIDGEPLSAAFGLPADIRAVSVQRWRDELFARGHLDREAKNPREDFARVRNGLKRKNLVAEREDRIWPVA